MANRNEIRVGLAALGIAGGLAAGTFTGRSAAELVERDIARVAAAAELASVGQSVLERDRAASEASDVARYKIAVTHAQPSRGPSDALVTIIEFCELYGEPCRHADALLASAIERRPLEVRRVFRSSGAATREGERALEVALAAHEQGKFWELRARLSAHDGAPSVAELKAHVAAIGMDWQAVERALERRSHGGTIAGDRALARALEVRSPIIHVNGRPLEGALTAASLDALIEEELARARLLMTEGAAREHIYAEIIKPAVWRAARSTSL